MPQAHSILANIWYLVAGLILFIYVALDGFDLGTGILSLTLPAPLRPMLLTGLNGLRDGAEAWLLLLAAALVGAFPSVSDWLWHQARLPMLLLLGGLAVRAVALRNARRGDLLWQALFGVGSLVAGACQGLLAGVLMQGVPDAAATAGSPVWLTPFCLLVAVGVVAGYVMMAAAYFGTLAAPELLPRGLASGRAGALVALTVATACLAWATRLHATAADHWITPPLDYVLIAAAAAGAAALLLYLIELRRGRARSAFLWSLAAFGALLGVAGASVYPYLVPDARTVQAAAAPNDLLVVLLTAAGILMPVLLVYNGINHPLFRRFDAPTRPRQPAAAARPFQEGHLHRPRKTG